MALFKVNRGNSTTLPSTMTDGWAYFCTDTGEFFIDYADAEGNLFRKQINADEAKKLTGYDIADALTASEVEIPTSKAVVDAIAAIPTPDVSGQIQAHNEDSSAHADIREAIDEHTHSWNELEDKPFGEEVTIDTDYYAMYDDSFNSGEVYVTYNGQGYYLDVKILDGVWQVESIESNNVRYVGNTSIPTPDKLVKSTSGDAVANYQSDNVPFLIVWSSTGAACMDSDGNRNLNWNLLRVYRDTKTLDEKYIPDTIARTNHTHSWNDLEDKPEFTADDAIQVLMELDMIDPVTDSYGAVFTDENGNIFSI